MGGEESKKVGFIGEGIACTFLIRKGFIIVERNYRKPYGEIDIVAKKAGIIHFIEVKTVSRENIFNDKEDSNSYRPEELVNSRKLDKLLKIAETYMHENRIQCECQIDVVGVLIDTVSKTAKCRLFEREYKQYKHRRV
jgi:putative endonuclease